MTKRRRLKKAIVKSRPVKKTEEDPYGRGHCSIYPTIDTPKECKDCYDSWPVGVKKYTRAVCKRKNWLGMADASWHNKGVKNNIVI